MAAGHTAITAWNCSPPGGAGRHRAAASNFIVITNSADCPPAAASNESGVRGYSPHPGLQPSAVPRLPPLTDQTWPAKDCVDTGLAGRCWLGKDVWLVPVLQSLHCIPQPVYPGGVKLWPGLRCSCTAVHNIIIYCTQSCRNILFRPFHVTVHCSAHAQPVLHNRMPNVQSVEMTKKKMTIVRYSSLKSHESPIVLISSRLLSHR